MQNFSGRVIKSARWQFKQRLAGGLILLGAGFGPLLVVQAVATEVRVPASRLVKTSVARPGAAPVQVSQRTAPSNPRSSPNGKATDLNQTIDDLFSDEALPPDTRQQNRIPRDTAREELPFPPGTTAQPRTQAGPTPAKPAPPRDEKVYRIDPSKQLIAVERSELKPGVIYLHHDPDLDKQVWSFVQADGTFWRAFGPGTTQPISRFDFGLPPDETVEELKRLDPRLAFDVTSTGASAFLRLDDQNDWQLVRHQSVASIMELETGRRWEQQWDRYLPVIHTSGDTWQHASREYQPAD